MLVLSTDLCRRRQCVGEGVRLTAMVTAGEREVGRHAHAHAQLTLVYAGRLLEIDDARRESLEAGELLFTPAGTSHANVVQGLRANIVIIDIAMDIAAPMTMPRARMRLPFVDAGELPERIREELLARDGTTFPTELVTQLLSTLRQIEDRPPAAPAWIETVIALLLRDYASDLTLEGLARRVGVSPSWLAHAFRHATGMTVGDSLRQVRTNAAARALRDTNAPIGAIALACGFSDQAHLSRVFRALKGMTPREWRRSAGERRVTAS